MFKEIQRINIKTKINLNLKQLAQKYKLIKSKLKVKQILIVKRYYLFMMKAKLPKNENIYNNQGYKENNSNTSEICKFIIL